MTTDLGFICRKHPRYLAKLRPRVACAGCWWLWFFLSNCSSYMPQEVKELY